MTENYRTITYFCKEFKKSNSGFRNGPCCTQYYVTDAIIRSKIASAYNYNRLCKRISKNVSKKYNKH